MSFAEGTRISHYVIRSKIGAGGMGEVYEAEDQKLMRPVAIKFIKRHEQTPEGAERRFLREARAASQMNHPNVVTIYEIGETGEHTYIVMEHVTGRNLRDLIRSGRLGAEAALDAAIQTADALAEAHARGIIHRDIKPENIIINERGRVKLLDFGLAKALEEPRPYAGDEAATAAAVFEHLTDSGVVVGTVPYMSPEQLRREAPLDQCTDVFSFGIVLYEMLTGEHPFRGDNVFVVGASILSHEPVRTDNLKPEIPPAAAHLFARLLEKDRRLRISSFDEIKRELESLKAQLGRRDDGGAETSLANTLVLAPPDAERLAQQTPSASKSGPSIARALAGPPTVLVLPFEAVGSSDEASFIGTGLASVITTDLARIGGLSVLSKAAGAGLSQGAAGRGAREQARELGANIILEGEVQRAGGRLRITARLIDVESERAVWGEQYRGDESELFEIQDKVCEGVAAALKVGVPEEVRGLLAQPATVNLDAFELYSKGRAFLERRDYSGNVDFAIRMFEEALKLDGDFALAHAGLGEAFWMKYEMTKDVRWVKRAEASSDRALVLDPNQPQVHVSLGIFYHGTGALESAVEEFRWALDLQPLNDGAHRWLGQCYSQMGRPDLAREHFEKAVELRPGYWENYNVLGTYYYTHGLYEKAAAQYRRVIRIQPDSPHGYNNLGAIYLLLGRYEEAVATHRRAIEIHPAAISYDNLGTSYFYLERYEEARDAYSRAIELNPSNDVPYRNLGHALLRLGRPEKAAEQFRLALRRLEEGLKVRSNDARLLRRLAVCQAQLGDERAAFENIARAVALGPEDVTTIYKRAAVCSLTGHTDEALEHLREALARGYSRAEAERDPDLDSLRAAPAYRTLFDV